MENCVGIQSRERAGAVENLQIGNGQADTVYEVDIKNDQLQSIIGMNFKIKLHNDLKC